MQAHRAFGFVNLPTGGNWTDMREGGVEFWLIVRAVDRSEDACATVRTVCSTGFHPGIVWWSSIISESFGIYVRNSEARREMGQTRHEAALVEMAICIGATQACMWSDSRGRYWEPTYDDLTEQGRTLWELIRYLYDVDPEIVTVLDT